MAQINNIRTVSVPSIGKLPLAEKPGTFTPSGVKREHKGGRLPEDGGEAGDVVRRLIMDRAERTFGATGLEVRSSSWGQGRAAFRALTLEGPPALVAPAAGELLRQLTLDPNPPISTPKHKTGRTLRVRPDRMS